MSRSNVTRIDAARKQKPKTAAERSATYRRRKAELEATVERRLADLEEAVPVTRDVTPQASPRRAVTSRAPVTQAVTNVTRRPPSVTEPVTPCVVTERAASPVTIEHPARSLVTTLEHVIIQGGLLYAAWVGMRASFDLLSGTLEGLAHGMGVSGAQVIIAGEMLFGHAVTACWRAGWRALAGALCALVLVCVGGEAWIASSRVDVAERLDQRHIIEGAQASSASAAAPDPTAIQGGPNKTQEVLDALAAARHEDQDRADATQDQLVGLATGATDWERRAPVLVAVIASLATATGSAVAAGFVRSLLSIPGGIAALLGAGAASGRRWRMLALALVGALLLVLVT